MIKVFIDSDVILDFLTKRKPFHEEAMRIFEYADRGALKLFISSLSINLNPVKLYHSDNDESIPVQIRGFVQNG